MLTGFVPHVCQMERFDALRWCEFWTLRSVSAFEAHRGVQLIVPEGIVSLDDFDGGRPAQLGPASRSRLLSVLDTVAHQTFSSLDQFTSWQGQLRHLVDSYTARVYSDKEVDDWYLRAETVLSPVQNVLKHWMTTQESTLIKLMLTWLHRQFDDRPWPATFVASDQRWQLEQADLLAQQTRYLNCKTSGRRLWRFVNRSGLWHRVARWELAVLPFDLTVRCLARLFFFYDTVLFEWWHCAQDIAHKWSDVARFLQSQADTHVLDVKQPGKAVNQVDTNVLDVKEPLKAVSLLPIVPNGQAVKQPVLLYRLMQPYWHESMACTPLREALVKHCGELLQAVASFDSFLNTHVDKWNSSVALPDVFSAPYVCGSDAGLLALQTILTASFKLLSIPVMKWWDRLTHLLLEAALCDPVFSDWSMCCVRMRTKRRGKFWRPEYGKGNLDRRHVLVDPFSRLQMTDYLTDLERLRPAVTVLLSLVFKTRFESLCVQSAFPPTSAGMEHLSQLLTRASRVFCRRATVITHQLPSATNNGRMNENALYAQHLQRMANCDSPSSHTAHNFKRLRSTCFDDKTS